MTPDLIIVTAGSHVTIDYSVAKPMAICLAAEDRIATPAGSVLIVELRPGMMVWTLDAAGPTGRRSHLAGQPHAGTALASRASLAALR